MARDIEDVDKKRDIIQYSGQMLLDKVK